MSHQLATRSVIRLLAGAITALAVLLGGLALPALAGPKDDLNKQRQENAQERERVESSLEGTDEDLTDLYLALDETNRRLPEAQAELDVKNQELDAAERHLDSVKDRLTVARAQKEDLQGEIATGSSDMDTASSALGEVARSAYRGDDGISALAIVFNATSPEDFASSYSVMNSAMRTQNETLTDLQNNQAVNRNRQARLDAVEERISDLEDEAADAVEAADIARDEAADLLAEINRLKADQEDQATALEKAKKDGQDQLEQLEADDAELAAQVAKIVEEEKAKQRQREKEAAKREAAKREAAKREAAKSNAAKSNAAKSNAAKSNAAKSNAAKSKPKTSNRGGGSSGGGGSSASSGSGGRLIPPFNRSGLHVTSPWGVRWYPITGGYWMHNGVDLRSRCGEAQVASASGTVTAVRPAAGNGTHGNQVMINHGTMGGHVYVTVYNHMSRFAVSTGQHVSQGQTIGYTGATGNVTGCHAHFEVWKDGSTINPMRLPGF